MADVDSALFIFLIASCRDKKDRVEFHIAHLLRDEGASSWTSVYRMTCTVHVLSNSQSSDFSSNGSSTMLVSLKSLSHNNTNSSLVLAF